MSAQLSLTETENTSAVTETQAGETRTFISAFEQIQKKIVEKNTESRRNSDESQLRANDRILHLLTDTDNSLSPRDDSDSTDMSTDMAMFLDGYGQRMPELVHGFVLLTDSQQDTFIKIVTDIKRRLEVRKERRIAYADAFNPANKAGIMYD